MLGICSLLISWSFSVLSVEVDPLEDDLSHPDKFCDVG